MGKLKLGKSSPDKSGENCGCIPEVAGNGLLHRRALLGRGIMVAGAMGAGAAGSLTDAAAEPLTEAPWSVEPGDATPPYGHPSPFEKAVVRTVDNPKNEPGGSAGMAAVPEDLEDAVVEASEECPGECIFIERD